MTFRELQVRFEQLVMAQVVGHVSPQQFLAALGQFACVDAQGRRWRLEATGVWFVWDGGQWQAAMPPLDAPVQPPAGPQGPVVPHTVPDGVAAQPYPAYAAQHVPQPAALHGPHYAPQQQVGPPQSPQAYPVAAQQVPMLPAAPALAHASPPGRYPPPPQAATTIPGWLMAAEAHVQSLTAQRAMGQLSSASYAEQLEQVKLQDPHGVWWKPRGLGEGWVAWNGQSWVNAPLPPGPAPQTSLTRSDESPATASSLDDDKDKPLGQRSQKWWDTFAVVGGIVSGWIWFAYASVRGLPKLAILGPAQRESWLDLVTPVLLMGILVVLLPFSRKLHDLFRKTPLVLKIVGMVVFAFVAVTLQYDTVFLSQREGLDFVTPGLMTVIPLLFIWLRRPVDMMLLPLQAVRKHIPRPIIVGVGLAIPFFTALVLYYVFGVNQYPLLRWNVLIGLVLSYLVLRTPKNEPPAARAATGAAVACLMLGATAVIVGWPGTAWADDFLRDPFNLNDGLRTPGFAVVISGVATTVVTMIINGVEVVRVFITAPPGTTAANEGPPPQSAFLVVVRTVDAKGMMSTTLDPQKTQAIFVYAHCEQVGKGPFPQGDPTIQFRLLSAQNVVACQDMGMAHGERCAQVSFLPKLGKDVVIPPTCVVQVSAGTGLISAPVTLHLIADLILAAEVVHGERRLPANPARPTFCVRYDKKAKQWLLGEVVLYFHTPESVEPVRPPYPVIWKPIQAVPPYLEFDAPTTDDGGLTWRVHPKVLPGVRIPDEWLMTNGEIELEIGCEAMEGP